MLYTFNRFYFENHHLYTENILMKRLKLSKKDQPLHIIYLSNLN